MARPDGRSAREDDQLRRARRRWIAIRTHFNAAVARQAVGKTSGEVLKDLDATFNRLRRQLARMTDAQLENNDWCAAWVIGGNTYGHYAEHWADI